MGSCTFGLVLSNILMCIVALEQLFRNTFHFYRYNLLLCLLEPVIECRVWNIVANAEQLELQEMVREFVAKEITPYAAEMDRENHAREGLFEKAAEMGLLNVCVPEEYGGMGLDSVTVAAIYEELGKGCAGIATSIAANSLASYPILLAGTEEQKQAHCDLLNEGKLAAFALTEPGAGLRGVT